MPTNSAEIGDDSGQYKGYWTGESFKEADAWFTFFENELWEFV